MSGCMISFTNSTDGSVVGWCQTHNCLAVEDTCLRQMAMDIEQLKDIVNKLQGGRNERKA